jgi:hypothetical protein
MGNVEALGLQFGPSSIASFDQLLATDGQRQIPDEPP